MHDATVSMSTQQLFCKQSDRLNLAAGTCAVPRLNLVGQAGLDPALVSDVGRK